MKTGNSRWDSLRQVSAYLKPYLWQTIVGPIAKMVEATIELFIPSLMGQMIDSVLNHQGEISYFVNTGLWMLLLILLGAASSYLCQYMASVVSQASGTDLRHDLYAKIQTFSYKELDKFGTVSLSNRLTLDVSNLQAIVNMFIRLFFRAPLLIIGATIAAFLISPKTALVFIPVIILTSIIVALIMHKTLPLQTKAQQETDKLGSLVQDHFSGVRVIRAFNRSEHERNYFAKNNKKVSATQEDLAATASFLTPGSGFIINLAIVIVIIAGKNMIKVGDLSSGDLIALINYLSLVLQGVTVFSNRIAEIPRALSSSERVCEVLNTEVELEQLTAEELEMIDKQTKRRNSNLTAFDVSPVKNSADLSLDGTIILCNQVDFSYSEKANLVLDDISFSLERGKSLGIMGATGSGKSTLARVIQRFYEPDFGQIYLAGQDFRTLSRQKIYNLIAYVPQKALLFSGTIKDNLSLGINQELQAKWGEAELEDRMWQALEVAQAKDFVQENSQGLNAKVERGGKNFSGGQRQRLCIARALVNQAPIIIFDDSASALDYATEAKLNRAVSQLPWNPAVITISQRVRSLYGMDEILLLDTGKIAGRGKHKELLAENKLYQEIYQSQEKAPNEKSAR